MSLTDYVIMPGEDYQNICDAIRTKTGKTDVIKSGDLVTEFNIAIENNNSNSEMSTAFIDGSITSISNDKATAITDYAFYHQSNLISADFSAATSVEQYAFSGCTSLTSVDLPVAINIGYSAFYGCTNLTNITIPDSVTSIGRQAFFGCTGLTDVYYTGDADSWNGISFGDSSSNPIYYADNLYFNGELVKDVVLSDSVTSVNTYTFQNYVGLTSIAGNNVTSIGRYTFRDCTGLTSVNFPTVTNVEGYAFYDCTSLTTVNFPAVTNVEGYAFYLCESLANVNFPALKTISGYYAFKGCKALTTIDLPSVTSIGNSAFYDCTSLSTLILRSTTMCTLNATNIFTNTQIASGTGYIYVPSALVDTYKTATNWVTYADQFRAIEDYPDITGG